MLIRNQNPLLHENGFLLALLLISLCFLPFSSCSDPLKLTFNGPAKHWTDAIPIGNGRLGAMVWGGVDTEILQLNGLIPFNSWGVFCLFLFLIELIWKKQRSIWMRYDVWLLRNQMGVLVISWHLSGFLSFAAIVDLGMFLLLGKPFMFNFLCGFFFYYLNLSTS